MSDREERKQFVSSLPGGMIWVGWEVYWRMILSVEDRFARKLGNCERVRKWKEREYFGDARREWWGAWEKYAQVHGFGPLLNLRADVEAKRVKFGAMKEFVLAMLRGTDDLEEQGALLRNHAEVIHGAARRGDVEFFRKLSLSLRNGGRRVKGKAEGFLAYYILGYWFSGMLWLMADKPGWAALCAYTGRKDITKDSYRMVCHRLRLKGYKDRGRKPLVGFDPVKGMHEIPGRG